ncbi:diguanylate cyclase (GGDEF) domain-containing protein [Jhaorihella thermophila]|uniref:Diguanylate cyclase (GGDEF) domain-containing protein n=2 Tax=Jhaorihella thermophila TaxID=488547 RepID=A0A1H5WP15_9RHOB|nr:diguanylate cyclase (GGDEF) domain-containing protein [Jhaorihella thermophila]
MTGPGAEMIDDMLDRLCPMHVRLGPDGVMRHFGPTLRKIRGGQSSEGQAFWDMVTISRPRSVDGMDALLDAARHGGTLRLRFRDDPAAALKGVVVPLDDGGAVVNLSFGISVVDAVRIHGLSAGDFAPTDLAIELLYLVEANAAAMEASRKLNLRLQSGMIAAEEQAFTDTLTGLKNRRALDHILARLSESGETFALMHLDLDFFKQVNDTYGHAAGDTVLQRAARVMVAATRERDAVARIGGDEFVLIFPRLVDPDKLAMIARRLIQGLEEPIPVGEQTCRISASIGIAIRQDSEEAAEDLLHRADIALYAAKRAGRGRFRVAGAGDTAGVDDATFSHDGD